MDVATAPPVEGEVIPLTVAEEGTTVVVVAARPDVGHRERRIRGFPDQDIWRRLLRRICAYCGGCWCGTRVVLWA